MKRIYLNIFILITVTISACEETIILDTTQVEPKLVVKAHLTNEEKIHKVQLSLSVDFYYSSKPPAVSNAEVIITDLTTGESYPFIHTTYQNEELEGYYFSQDEFAGQVGHEYELQVKWKGEIYIAKEKIHSVSEIDSIKYRINPFELSDPEKPGQFYEILLYAKEPQETEDYYYFEFLRNDSLILDDENAIYFTDDKFLQGEIKDLPSPVYYKKGDVGQLKMFSITRSAYIYLSDLFNIMNNDSGMFSPPPANPRNNFSGDALGYFMVSSVSTATIVIE